MPKINKFNLKNFKGIEEIEIDLVDRTNCPVLTFIGLNESGKTTILEGLSHFVSGDRSVSGLFEGAHAKASGAGLIPVHKKAAFTSNVEISGLVELDDCDIKEIELLCKGHKLHIDVDAIREPFYIKKTLTFEDSSLKSTNNYWLFNLSVKSQKRSQFKKYQRPAVKAEPDLWLQVANLIEERLPQISYFPTFLVDMPAKIYLREHEGEKAINRHYRYVFQDVLDSLVEGLSLDKHVCKRISDFKESEKNINWFSAFFGGVY